VLVVIYLSRFGSGWCQPNPFLCFFLLHELLKGKSPFELYNVL